MSTYISYIMNYSKFMIECHESETKTRNCTQFSYMTHIYHRVTISIQTTTTSILYIFMSNRHSCVRY